MKQKQWVGIIVAGIVFIAVCTTGILSNTLKNKLVSTSAENTSTSKDLFNNIKSQIENDSIELPDKDFIGVLNIVGTIQASSGTSGWNISSDSKQYNHSLYMDYLEKLEENDKNKGLLLYVDSPGGTVYESDEMYLKILEYKEKTGRPVYAYFASQACSGGYYISMAADKIYANRNTWTGSIGVIISLTNYQKLYKKLGIEEIDITSGKNKSMGSGALELTDEQRDILQGMVDEAYDQFTSIVSEGRKMDVSQVKKLADGRIYTAKQAKENGLVDEIGSEEELKAEIEKQNELSEDIEYHEPQGNSMDNFFSSLMGSVQRVMPRSDAEIASQIIEEKGKGVLMYYAD